MAEETKIGMKLEKELEPIKEMCKPLEEAVKHQLNMGIESVDTKELGEVVDMIKDLYEAKEKLVKACYYKQIMEAMEEHDFEGEEDIMDEGRRGYRGQPRDSRGRYTSRRGYEEPMDYDMMPEWYRDMDRDMGKMYYSGGNMGGGSSSGMSGGSSGGSNGGSGGSRGYSEGEGGQYASRMQRDGREGRSGQSRRGYMEAKEQGADKQKKMKELEDYMKELSSDVTEMIGDASQEEKNMLKNKMQVLMQKI